jgi:hypothetical protein
MAHNNNNSELNVFIYFLFYFNKDLEFSIPMNKSTGPGPNLMKAEGGVNMGSSTSASNMGTTGAGGNVNNLNSKEQIDFTNFLQHANHPFVVFFTLLFKAVAIVSFLVLNLFMNNEALVFIIVVIFSAFDFWFVKNVSGRYKNIVLNLFLEY